MLRRIAAALSGLALTLLPLASQRVGASASPVTGYSFAQSSLAGGGFENVIAADPRHNGVVLSGGDVSGLERSADFGKTWVASQNGTIDSTYHPVAAIAFDPASPHDVYAATNGGVAESTDDGVSWTPLAPGPDFNGANSSNPSGMTGEERCVGSLLAIDDTTTPHTLYAASFDEGVWAYSKGAWSVIVPQTQLGTPFCLTSLAWGPAHTLLVATWGEGVFSIAHPNPAGSSASPVSGAPAVVQELVGLTDGDTWGAAYTTGVGVITGTGTSAEWTTRLSPAGAEHYMSIAAYVNGGEDTVIAGSDDSVSVANQPTLHQVLHQTTNSGSSWTSLPTSTAQVSTELLGPTLGNPWWHTAAYAPPLLYSGSMVPSSIVIEHERAGDDIWIAGFGGNWRLLGAEKQTTFYPADYGLGATVNHHLALGPTTISDPRSGQRVYLGDTDWGMFSSADGFSTQQGISDDQFSSTDTVGYATVVDGGVSPPVVYVGVGNRDSNTQGDLMSAAAPAMSPSDFQSTGLGAATGGGRPLAVGVVDTSGTPTLIVAVEASGLWTSVGTGPWMQDTSLFMSDPTNTPTAAIATGSGAQAQTVYAYYPQRGVFRSLDAGAPGTWTEIWAHPSVATVPFLMVDSSDPTRLWVSANGGLYRLDGAATATITTYTTTPPPIVIAGTTSGLAELNGQVFTTELVSGTGLELQVSELDRRQLHQPGQQPVERDTCEREQHRGRERRDCLHRDVGLRTDRWHAGGCDHHDPDLDTRPVAPWQARHLHRDRQH